MGFIAPFLPAIGGAIGSLFGGRGKEIGGAAGTAGAGIVGGLLARPSGEEKAVTREQALQAGLQTEGMRRALGFGRELAPLALRTFREGTGATGGAIDYWRRILSGRTGAAAALSPEINQIINSYRQARIASRGLAPRGGGASALTRRIDEEVLPGQIAGLLATARPVAAEQLGGLGFQLGQLGTTGMTTAGQLFGRGTGAGGALLQYGPNVRQQQFDFGTRMASMLDPLINILFPDKGGGAGTIPPPTIPPGRHPGDVSPGDPEH